ncbi:MAG: hypothetical protein QOE75_1114 [Solirubrobacterales bacterium]|jgi:hypothetical protein|nr:hypothetical protein [Solirubrobacterales bacterium]
MSADAPARRRRSRPQPRDPGGLRPTDVVVAFFVAGLAARVLGSARPSISAGLAGGSRKSTNRAVIVFPRLVC